MLCNSEIVAPPSGTLEVAESHQIRFVIHYEFAFEYTYKCRCCLAKSSLQNVSFV